MQVSQRHTGWAQTLGVAQYTLDRWLVSANNFTTWAGNVSQAAFTWADGALAKGLAFSSVTTTGSGALFIVQKIESQMAKHLNGKELTVSIDLYQNTGSNQNFALRLWSPSAEDNFGSLTLRQDEGTIAVVPSGVTTRYTHTFTLTSNTEYNNGLYFEMRWSLTSAVTSAAFYAGRIQLELGGVASEFEHKSFAAELAECQRYYEKSYDYATVPGAPALNGHTMGRTNSTVAQALGAVTFKVPKRVTPTVTIYSSSTGASGNFYNHDGGGSDVTAVQTNNNQYGLTVYGTVPVNQWTSLHYVADAEL